MKNSDKAGLLLRVALLKSGLVQASMQEWQDESTGQRWAKLGWRPADLEAARSMDLSTCTISGTSETEAGAAGGASGAVDKQLNLKPFLLQVPETQRHMVVAEAFERAGLARPVEIRPPRVSPGSASLGNRLVVTVGSGQERLDAARKNRLTIEIVAGFGEPIWVAPVGEPHAFAVINDGLDIADLEAPFCAKLVAAFRGLDPPINIQPYILPTFKGFGTSFGGHVVCFAVSHEDKTKVAELKVPARYFESVCKGGLRVEAVRGSINSCTGQSLTLGPVQELKERPAITPLLHRAGGATQDLNKRKARPRPASGGGDVAWWGWIWLLLLLGVAPVEASAGAAGGGPSLVWALALPIVVVAINVRKLLREQLPLVQDWVYKVDPDVLVVSEPGLSERYCRSHNLNKWFRDRTVVVPGMTEDHPERELDRRKEITEAQDPEMLVILKTQLPSP